MLLVGSIGLIALVLAYVLVSIVIVLLHSVHQVVVLWILHHVVLTLIASEVLKGCDQHLVVIDTAIVLHTLTSCLTKNIVNVWTLHRASVFVC